MPRAGKATLYTGRSSSIFPTIVHAPTFWFRQKAPVFNQPKDDRRDQAVAIRLGVQIGTVTHRTNCAWWCFSVWQLDLSAGIVTLPVSSRR
uniref:Uncharacterized protein n=1 Tax=Trichuris muris TaxID=70415 RepID=A0A5S6QG14_TRIMR